MKPLVTVGIPTYNRPQYLQEAIRRIHNQTYDNLEIIISDNQSPSPKAIDEIVQPWLQKDSRIRFVRQPVNIGAIRNFKYLLDEAKGDYFMWAADDDELEPTFIEKLLNGLLNDPTKVISMSAFDVTDHYSGGYTKKQFLSSLQKIAAPTAYQRLINYARQPDYEQRARILWGVLKTDVVRRAFAACFNRVSHRPDLVFADLPVEFQILTEGDLFIHPENLFHVNLLPSSVGLADMKMFARREVEMCRRGFAAYRNVVNESQLPPWQKRRINLIFRSVETRTILMVAAYYTMQRYFPGLARWFKKIWFKLMT